MRRSNVTASYTDPECNGETVSGCAANEYDGEPNVVRHRSRLPVGNRLVAALLVVLSICAIDTVGRAQNAGPWPDVGAALEGGDADGQGDAALLIGIEDYAFVPDIEGAEANLNDWYTFLRKSRGVPQASIITLRNQQATREEILDAAQVVAKKARAGGTLWLVFIGHGAPAPDGSEGLLIGVDVQQQARSLAARGVGQHELLALFEKGKQKKVVAVLDACFSGLDSQGESLVAGLQPLIPVAEASFPKGAVVMTAAGADQFAGPLPGGARPAFSYLVLGALRGWADSDKSGSVTTEEAHRYASDVFETLVTGRRQQPQLYAPGGRAEVLTTGLGERGPDLDAMRTELAAAGPARGGAASDTPVRRGNVVKVEASEPAQRFDVSLVLFDGTTRRCTNSVTVEQPCVFEGVTAGPARLNVAGDVELSEKVEVPTGSTVVSLYDHPGWAYGVGGIMMGAGEFGLLASFLALASCDSPDGDCSTTGPTVGLVVSAVSMFTGLGLLSWALWEDIKHDWEEYEVNSFPTTSRNSSEGEPSAGTVSVAPWVSAEGGGVGLGLSWN